MANYYQQLGVKRTDDAETIRKAYKKLARKYHPDVSKQANAEERFKEINAAYDVVGDDKKRKLYDEFGEASLRAGFNPDQARAFSGGGGRPFGGGGGFNFNGGADMDDLLGSMFGGGVDRGPRRGPDQQTEITVDFMTVVQGGEHTIQIRRPDGRAETLVIPVPAGAKDGGRVRLKGQGLPPRGGGPCGDLLVNIKVRAHPHLRRTGNDLEMEVPITVHEAIAGASVTVPTPTGDVKVTVPPGARSGARMRIRNRGIQTRTPGHLYLILRPMVPQSDDPEIIAAAQRLDEAYAVPVRADLKL